jgi:hypothetical protein
LTPVASRCSLVGGLLRKAVPANRHSVLNFLRGLSRDELECLAEFQGACILEADEISNNPYRLLAEYFDADYCGRWNNACDRAHKTFVVLAYLDLLDNSISIRIQTSRAAAA